MHRPVCHQTHTQCPCTPLPFHGFRQNHHGQRLGEARTDTHQHGQGCHQHDLLRHAQQSQASGEGSEREQDCRDAPPRETNNARHKRPNQHRNAGTKTDQNTDNQRADCQALQINRQVAAVDPKCEHAQHSHQNRHLHPAVTADKLPLRPEARLLSGNMNTLPRLPGQAECYNARDQRKQSHHKEHVLGTGRLQQDTGQQRADNLSARQPGGIPAKILLQPRPGAQIGDNGLGSQHHLEVSQPHQQLTYHEPRIAVPGMHR